MSMIPHILFRAGVAELRRLRHTRGPSRRTARRIALAARFVVLAGSMLGLPLANEVEASGDPQFESPFLIPYVGRGSAPALVDIDNDGDLDAFVGIKDGDTIFFWNTGSATSPALVSSSGNFGLINFGPRADPTLVDIDGDGDLDAFVGIFSGFTVFFRNTGSIASPAFASSSDAFGLTDVGSSASPELVDIDSDGDLDAFIGEVNGNVIFFRNTGSVANPAFVSSSDNFGLTDVGAGAKPAMADIDGDGDLDAFVGDSKGYTTFFRNTGSTTMPAFVSSSDNFGLSDVGLIANPTLVDIDGDGDLDALIGADEVHPTLFRNTGSVASPAFVSSSDFFGLTDIGMSAHPAMVDIDGDGDLDAFIGNYAGDTTFFRNTGSATSPAFASSSDNFGLTRMGRYGRAAPAFGDIDGDGDFDAFVSELDGYFGDLHGIVTFFRNTGNVSSPAFVSSSDNFDLEGGNPALADIDGDGDLDAFLGENFFRNTGSAVSPAFSSSTAWLSSVSGASPTLVDIDGDGDLDAFVGKNNGRTLFFRNTGSVAGPAFVQSVEGSFGLADVMLWANPELVDIDGDGDLDAFVGEYGGSTIFFRNTAPILRDTTVGLYDPVNGAWFLRNANANGFANQTFVFGPANAGWIPISGDWDANRTWTAGMFDSVNGAFFLRNTHASGPADETFFFGPANAGWQPIAGDWDGNGTVTVGLLDPANGAFFLRDAHANGPADHTFLFGPPDAGWIPIAGDWNGDDTDTVGLYDPANGAFFLRDSHANGPADHTFLFGPPGAGWIPIAGDWNADGTDTVGLYDPMNRTFYLRDTNTDGPADHTILFGPANAGWLPIAGDWDGS